MSGEVFFVQCTRTTVIDDDFWQANLPTVSALAKTQVTTRIKSMQTLMTSRYVTATSMSTQMVSDGQTFVILVTRE